MEHDSAGTPLAEALALDLRQRLGFLVEVKNYCVTVKNYCVTLFLPKNKREFMVWISTEYDNVEGACFPHDSCTAEFCMDSYPATAASGLLVIREMVREILEREMGSFSECSNGAISEKELIDLGLINPDPIVELDEVLAALSARPGSLEAVDNLKEMQEESWRSR